MAATKAAALSALLQQQQCQAIYAALDAGNSRLAIQQADHVLRNNGAASSHTLARALKALALYRIRNEAEAVKEVTSLASHLNPAACDQSILTPMAFVLTRTGHKEKAADLLDAASKGRPDDLDISIKAFEALLAVPDYLKAQQLATRMHKAFGESVTPSHAKKNGKQPVVGNPQCSSARNQYFWWSTQSYLLLSQETPQAQGAPLALTLAERMIQKHLSSEQGSFDEQSQEDIGLYISVLLAQADKLSKEEDKCKKQKEALQLLQSDPGSQIAKKSLAVGQLKLDLLKRTGDWSKLEEETRQLIDDGDRNWMTLEKWLEAVVGLVSIDAQESGKAIKKADELAGKDSQRRDYPLLRLALHHQLRSAGFSYTPDTLVKLIEEYFDAFSSKLCCYDDLLPFLDSLRDEEVSRLLASPSISSGNVAKSTSFKHSYASEDDVIKSLNATKIRVRILPRAAAAEVGAQIEQLISAFYSSLSVSAKVPKTVPRAGTDFLLIASQLILASSPCISVLVHLASILTHAANASPASYALKLLCMRLYLLLGCQKEARKLWLDLKIRGIQNESLGWLWIGSTLSVPNPEQEGREDPSPIVQWKHEANVLYREVEFEQSKLVMTAFRRGNYSSVREFIDFGHRIQRSTQRLILELDTVRHDLQLLKDGKERQRRVRDVLEKTEQIVKGGLLQQWDTAVLPSFCGRHVPSLVNETGTDHKVGVNWNLAFVKRQARYVALLGGPGISLPELLQEQTTDQTKQAGESRDKAFAAVLDALSSGSQEKIVESLDHLIELSTGPQHNQLPWQETSNINILIDLYLLLWHIRDSSREQTDERRLPTDDVLEASLSKLRNLFHSRLIEWKQSRPITLSSSRKVEAEVILEVGKTETSQPESSPSEEFIGILERILESQKGGRGSREKVFKDVKDEISRNRRNVAARIQELLKEFA